MLLFFTEDTHNYFAVDNATGKMNLISGSAYQTLLRFQHHFGGIDILRFATKGSMDMFRKRLKEIPIKDVPLADTRTYLLHHYPEYFI